jgi:hypothetical protein
MLRELDHDRLPWNVKDIDADVDDPAPARTRGVAIAELGRLGIPI